MSTSAQFDINGRYLRHMSIPGFGPEGQARLASSRVLVAGLGGLGSPAALYLAAAGVGTLCLLDSDRVDVSNLQRQLLHKTPDVGRPKPDSAADTISALNPGVKVERMYERLTEANAPQLIAKYDAVVEASDNFLTKYVINDACLAAGKPFATAGISCLSGQGQFVVPGETACLRCALPEAPRDAAKQDNPPGVLGAAPGVLGSLQAMEVLRWLVGMWKPQPDKAGLLHSLDGMHMRLKTMRILPRRGCRCGLWSRQND